MTAVEPKRVRCPRCRSDQLSLVEVMEEIKVLDDGVVLADGVLYGLGDGYAEPGGIISARLRCQDCDHYWRPRRPVGGPYQHLIDGHRDGHRPPPGL